MLRGFSLLLPLCFSLLKTSRGEGRLEGGRGQAALPREQLHQGGLPRARTPRCPLCCGHCWQHGSPAAPCLLMTHQFLLPEKQKRKKGPQKGLRGCFVLLRCSGCRSPAVLTYCSFWQAWLPTQHHPSGPQRPQYWLLQTLRSKFAQRWGADCWDGVG